MLPQAELELMHYASQYYDPVKAHEYYIRNRDLKNKQKAEDDKLSSESRQRQSEATAYVRNQISTAKTNELEKQTKDVDELLKALQTKAEESALRIKQKLEEHLATLNTQLQIPANASPKVRAFLEKQHAKQSASAKNASRAQLQALGKNLRTAISVARTQYAEARKATVEKYKTALETETKNIRNEVR